MNIDSFVQYADSPDFPARQATVVTPDNSVEIPTLPKGLLIGGAGTIVLRAVDSAADVSITVTAGQLLPIRAQFIRATGTTATNIVALA